MLNPRSPLAAALLVLPLWLGACGDDDKDSGDGGSSATAACELAQDNVGCPECYDGEVTCSYGEDHSATEGSCGDCQARSALYQQLCDAGIEDSEADILAGVSCSDPVRDSAE